MPKVTYTSLTGHLHHAYTSKLIRIKYVLSYYNNKAFKTAEAVSVYDTASAMFFILVFSCP